MLLLLQGTAFVYQGEELGAANPPWRGIAGLEDVSSLNYYRSRVAAGVDPDEVLRRLRHTARDHARAPLDWAEARRQRSAADSVFTHHRRLVALRKELPVLVDGTFALLDPEDPQTFCYDRRSDAGRVRVVANFSSEPVPASRVPAGPEGAVRILDTHPHEADPDAGSDAGLAPWRSYVWILGGEDSRDLAHPPASTFI